MSKRNRETYNVSESDYMATRKHVLRQGGRIVRSSLTGRGYAVTVVWSA